MKSRTLMPVLLAALMGLAACGGPTQFLDREADLPYYERVAVVPFVSLTQDRAAGYRLTNIFFTELLRRDFAQVMEPGQFAATMNTIRGGTPMENSWSSADLVKLGEAAKVEGIFMGTVRSYGMERAGREQFPLISVEIRLVDAMTGRLVWSASDTRKGGPGLPILGWGETHTLGELASDMCRDLLRTLPRD